MLREIDLNIISDGKKYSSEDMVRIGSSDCKNCHKCCTGMGDSIILDPLDIYNMQKATGENINDLLASKLTLNVVDGIIAPNIKMLESVDRCAFLNKEGRCVIHDYRPGFCRLFPLGRVYEGDGFYYIHQNKECPYPDKSKVKIKNWLGYDSIKAYEEYVLSWHSFLKTMQEFINSSGDEGQIKTLNMLILKTFYMDEYDMTEEFYSQYYIRITNIHKTLGMN